MQDVFKKSTAFFVAIFLMVFTSNAQSDLAKADEAFRLLKYEEAIKLYEKILIAKDDNPDVKKKLSDAYINTSQYLKAEPLLEGLNKTNNDASVMLKYANVLILNDKKQKANEVLQAYIKAFPATDEYKKLFQITQHQIKSDEKHFKTDVEKCSFSSDVSDFSPTFYGDKILFTSQKGGKTDPWTGRSFTNLYMTDENKQNPSPLEGNLNGKFHNGAATFLNEEWILFTRNNAKKGKEQDFNLILALAVKENDKWNFKEEFPFNDKNFSNAYPTFISDQNLVVFASDRPGGFGGMDLYYSTYNDGKWGSPINLGSGVNTTGNEVFPSFDGKTFYFSSNGHPGQGGLDIFKAELRDLNLGKPINSSRDDFGLCTNDNLSSGYFSSNRSGNGDIDNIWQFKKVKIELPPQKISITGKVIDEFTKQPLKEVLVKLKNTTTGQEQLLTTKDDGRFSFEALEGQSYTLVGEKNNIMTSMENITNIVVSQTYYYTLLHNDPRFSLEGFALKTNDKKGVEGVTVVCFNKSKSTEETVVTNEAGFFKFQLDQDSEFEISGTKDGYYTSVSDASTKGLNRSQTLYVKLFLNIEEVIIGDTRILGKETFGSFDFDPVYYDLDKDNIRPDAALALDKVVEFMQKNPKLTIELGSHTDSRSSDEYNEALSERRANSAVNYIVSKGVENSRITAKGYGENKLINNCSDGVNCAEDLHQLNRRTEIKVTGYY
jgi:outer membrane protein OmpA-like peptidoglycan-associated protein/tetratricopeptide (TPR) repeat protein